MDKVRIGTRGSALALWQAREVARLLREAHPGLEVEEQIFKTRGDHILDRPLSEVGGKGLFTKELEVALLAGEIDIAVHSLKDMPTVLPEGLSLGAIPRRADARDVLLFRRGERPESMRVIGSSSLRRASLARARWPEAEVVSIRGNVQTRIGRLFEEGERRVDGVILAMAGLLRLGLLDEPKEYESLPLNPERWTPAAAQGALAIEQRAEDPEVSALLAPLHHSDTAVCVESERAFLRAVEGDCRVPVGAWATVDQGRLRLKGFIGDLKGEELLCETRLGAAAAAVPLGAELATELLAAGGAELLAKLR